MSKYGGCEDNNGNEWPPDECEKCYGGTWRSGGHCEDSECVPEATTLVLFATGLLFLVGYIGLKRRKTK